MLAVLSDTSEAAGHWSLLSHFIFTTKSFKSLLASVRAGESAKSWHSIDKVLARGLNPCRRAGSCR